MDKKQDSTDLWIKIVLYLVTAILTVYHGARLNLPVVLDEVGTMANTAFMVGFNWMDTVEAMGGFYYKYGQSVLYAPFFFIFQDPYMLYKSIMVFHAIVLSTIPVMAYSICRRHLKITDKKMAVLFALVGGWMSSLWLYSYYARAEMLLIYLPWVILVCILEAYRASEEMAELKKKGRFVLYSVLVGFLPVYGYMAHSRGLVFIIAVFITIVFVRLFLKKNVVHWWYYLASTGVFLVVDRFLSGYFKENVYGEAGTRRASLESFDFEFMRKMFTLDGMKTQAKLCLGWLYNAFCSTYGLTLIAIVAGVLLLLASLRKKYQVTVEETLVTLFSLLNFIGAFLLGVIFFFRPAHLYYTGEVVKRADRLIYGRYIVGSIGLLCLLAVYIMVYKREVFRIRGKLVTLAVYALVFVLFNAKASHYLNIGILNARYFLSMAMFLNIEPYGATTGVFPEASEALFKAGVLGSIIFIILLLCSLSKKKFFGILMSLVIIVSSITIFRVEFVKLRESRDAVVKERFHPITSFIRGMEGLYEEFPFILKMNSAPDIKFFQFPLARYRVTNPRIIKRHEVDDYLIISKKGDYPLEFYEGDFYLFEEYDYENERIMVLAKGEGIKNKLEEMGYSMVRFETGP